VKRTLSFLVIRGGQETKKASEKTTTGEERKDILPVACPKRSGFLNGNKGGRTAHPEAPD